MIYEPGEGRLIESPSREDVLKGLHEVGPKGSEVIIRSKSELEYCKPGDRDGHGF
jgi:hypothetical protein